MSQHHQNLNRRRWQSVRRSALERDAYRCVECLERGRGGAGKLEVHHIEPLNEGGLAYELANLKTLCRNCHIEHSVPAARLEWRRYIGELRINQ